MVHLSLCHPNGPLFSSYCPRVISDSGSFVKPPSRFEQLVQIQSRLFEEQNYWKGLWSNNLACSQWQFQLFTQVESWNGVRDKKSQGWCGGEGCGLISSSPNHKIDKKGGFFLSDNQKINLSYIWSGKSDKLSIVFQKFN